MTQIESVCRVGSCSDEIRGLGYLLSKQETRSESGSHTYRFFAGE